MFRWSAWSELASVPFIDFGGVFDETVHHSTKFLLGWQVHDIIQLRIEASLRDMLDWYDLQDLC